MDTPAPHRPLLEQFALIGKALSSASRLALLDLLAQGEKPVEMLARQSEMSVTSASNHLKELRTAALVATRREGTFVYYRLADPAVDDLLRRLREVARKQLAGVQQVVRDYFEDRDALECIDADELRRRLRAKDVIALDVRPADEYASGHIPGAVSIPLGELELRLSELPPDRDIVAYCRGPYCVLSLRAVAILRRHGRRAWRMADGVPEWRARGLTVRPGTAQ